MTGAEAGPDASGGEVEVRESLPAPGFAEVRIVAATAETARMIAEVLRLRFAVAEQGGRPAGGTGDGTRLSLTVDTVHIPEASGPFQLRLVGGDLDRGRGRGRTHGVATPPRSTEPDDTSGDRPRT